MIRDHTVKNRHLDVKKAISKADMDKMKRGGPSPGSSPSGRGYDRGHRDPPRDRHMDRGGDLWDRRDSWSNGGGSGGGWANGDQWAGSSNYRGNIFLLLLVIERCKNYERVLASRSTCNKT